MNGQLECLKYAHEHGCPWDEGRARAAAENGHLECLKYAREHGCPWDEWTCACRPEWTFGVFEVRARARVSLGLWTCEYAAGMDIWSV